MNQWQLQAVRVVREKGGIGNSEYQETFGVSKRTAHRDLSGLVEKGVFERIGTTGKGTSYALRKRVTNGPNGPRSPTRQEADKHDMSAKKNMIMTMNAAISMSVLIEEVDSA